MHPNELDPAAAGHFEQFGIGREVLDQVMRAALSLGATDCDLFFEHKVSTAVALSDSKVNRASTDVDLGLGVRARVGDQIGYAYTEAQRLLYYFSTSSRIWIGDLPAMTPSCQTCGKQFEPDGGADPDRLPLVPPPPPPPPPPLPPLPPPPPNK